MSITSFEFAIFVSITMLIYYLMPQKYQWILLLLASYIFYGFFGYTYYIFLWITTISTYVSSRWIDKEHVVLKKRIEGVSLQERRDIMAVSKNKRKVYLVTTLVLNFGILFFFKYYDIAREGAYLLTGNERFQVVEHLILPLGISFYMFQSMGYLMDIYWGKYPVEKNPFKLALFISFFPQIIQGPISRYPDLAPQLFGGTTWKDDSVKEGIYHILFGLFKKLIIADRLFVLVSAVMENHWKYSGSVIFVTIFIYGIQIYCDFSGGIHIVTGIARLFGIHLVKNFNRPLFATGIRDFWRRWHITLGSWMRDYVFYPLSLSKGLGKVNKRSRKILGAKRGKLVTVVLSSIIVYVLVGLWHGPSLRYIVFGLWHGFFIAIGLATEDIRYHLKEKIKRKWLYGLGYLLTLGYTTIVVTLGRYFSRADSLRQALSMFKRTLLQFEPSAVTKELFMNLGLEKTDVIVALVSVMLLLVFEMLREVKVDVRHIFEQSPLMLQFMVLYIFVAGITYFGFYAQGELPSAFIYMQY